MVLYTEKPTREILPGETFWKLHHEQRNILRNVNDNNNHYNDGKNTLIMIWSHLSGASNLGFHRKGKVGADRETIQTHTCSLFFFIKEGFDWVMTLHSYE